MISAKTRHQHPWPKTPTTWIENRTLHISVSFTWHLPDVRALCLQQDFRYDNILIGGPAICLMPTYLHGIPGVKTRDRFPGVLQRINPQATRTTEGCPNRCKFCGVKRIYPRYKELSSWPLLPIICDDNLLAASHKHLDKVLHRLRVLPWVDFNQGLEARLLTPEIARQIAALNEPLIRLAWDKVSEEHNVLRGIERLLGAGIPKRLIRCYVLIGYRDTPSEALYRLQILKALHVDPLPMRFTPLDSLARKAHVATTRGWTANLLTDYMRYWSRLQYFRSLPFAEYKRNQRRRRDKSSREMFER